jgi:transposase
MLTLAPTNQIFLVTGVTDMRKSFNGLMAIVRNDLGSDPLSGGLFVFSNRRRDRLKILFWDSSGLWVCAKRLERGTFAWPQPGTPAVELSPEELTLLLGGLDLKEVRPRRWYRRRGGEAPNASESATAKKILS